MASSNTENPNPGQKTSRRSSAEKPLPLPAEGFGSLDFWQKQIKAAEQLRDDDQKPTWDRNVKSYLAQPMIAAPDVDRIIVPKDFSNVEQKKAQLFFQLPEIQCLPRRPEFADAVPIAQAVLRFYLGRHRVDSLSLMNELLFDLLCPSGIMCSKIGYESTQDGTKSITVQAPNPAAGQPLPPAPALGGTLAPPPGMQAGAAGSPGGIPGGVPTMAPGSILGLNAPPQPPTIPMPVEAPRIISERYFWERISPAKALIPEKFRGSNYDRSPWLGFEFLEPSDLIKRKYNLGDEDFAKMSGDDEHTIRSDKNVTTRAQVDTVRGWEIYYRACLYDPNEKNPDRIRLLVLIEGLDRPVRHKNSPYQKEDPDTGQLMGMRGYPIHIGATRYVSDTAYPPSEVSISRVAVDELSKFRTQMVILRDRAVPQIGFDPVRMGGPQTEEKIRRGIFGGWIPIPALDANNPPAVELAKAHANQDNYRANDYLNRDIQDVWGMGENQQGQEAEQSRSATEMNLIQAASNNRVSKDRERVVDYFVKGAEKLWSLLQLFADQEEYVQIVGDDGARRLQAWDKTKIAGEFVFEAEADSAAMPDYNQERQMLLKEYELLRRDPNWNAVPMLHQIAQAFDQDPHVAVIDQTPPKGPEPVKAGITFNGQDLDIGRPEFPIVLALLRQSGYQIPDELVMQAQAHKQMQSAIMANSGIADPLISAGMAPSGPTGVPPTPNIPTPHPGTAPKTERLNKHQDRQTGQLGGRRPLRDAGGRPQ